MTAGQFANRVYLSLKPHLRFAVASAFKKENEGELICGGPEVAILIREALHARGWTDEAIRERYAEYTMQCYRGKKENLFPGGKL